MAPSYRPCAVDLAERKPARWVAGLGAPSSASSSAAWCGMLGADPAEMKRRRRVAGYKAYAVEGKVKASIRRGLRWIKAKCSTIVHH
ncbi:hypothetical protein ACP70R_005093 [Stipagrostis hirtigluma subsp. patula]